MTLEPFAVEGIGLHTGLTVRLRVSPSDEPLHFRLGGVRVPVALENVRSSELCTTLEAGGVRIQTVEHLLAALSLRGVWRGVLELDGPEVPDPDGCASTWLDRVRPLGPARGARVEVLESVEVREGARWIRFSPGAPELEIHIDFPHPRIGRQSLSARWEELEARVGHARTFGFLHEIEALRARGLARGGSVESALVFTPDGVLGSPREPDEPVRHKALDLVGDLALLGARLVGRVETERPGHALTVAGLRALMRRPGATRCMESATI